MEPQKSIVLPVILSILISALVFGSLGYYVAQSNNQTNTPLVTTTSTPAPSNTPTLQPTATPSPSPATTPTNIFSFSTLNAGDKVGGMTVQSRSASTGDVAPEDGLATFTGTIQVTGSYTYIDKDGFYALHTCMDNFNAESKKLIPQVRETDKPTQFCFDETTSKQFGAPGDKGTATITITSLKLVHGGTDMANFATLNKIVTKTKTN